MKPGRQRGVAVVTAILVVAVAASTATYMLSQQSATLNQTALVASRAQADALAQAGLDWARGTLAEDARGGTIDWLDEPWARPLVGLPVERAIVSGAIADEQSRYNLNNLVKDGRRSDADVQILSRLLDALGLDASLALAELDWVDGDADLAGTGGAEDAHYLALRQPYRAANRPLAQVEELYGVRGFDAKAVPRLRPFVTAIPGRTAVNANTAPAEVIAAILPELGREEVRDLVASRRAKPFNLAACPQDSPYRHLPQPLTPVRDVVVPVFCHRLPLPRFRPRPRSLLPRLDPAEGDRARLQRIRA